MWKFKAKSAGTSADKEFLQPGAGARRHQAGDIAAGRGKFRAESAAMLPDIGVPPVHVPGAKALPSRQLVLDLKAGPGFTEIDVGGLCSNASSKNECRRKDQMFHGLNNPDLMRVFPFYLEVRQVRMVLKSSRCTSSPAREVCFLFDEPRLRLACRCLRVT